MNYSVKVFLSVLGIGLLCLAVLLTAPYLINKNDKPIEKVYWKYELSNGKIICCRSAWFGYGGSQFSMCLDNKEYHSQTNVIDYNEKCEVEQNGNV
jgi:hypothetical protein